jgi:glycosyltransferase involved in cell wall biosynthesis
MKCGGPSLKSVTLVLGTSAGGMGAHVRMLAAGLSRRGIAVTVAGPPPADARFSFSAVPSVRFSPVEISGGPRPGDLAGILRLRKLLLRAGGNAGRDARHVAHAHGLRAGALVVLALLLVRGQRRPRVVVTAHNAPPPGGGTAGAIYRLLELVVARGADLVLCVAPDLEARMRAAGAGRVARAVIAAADPSGPAVASAPGEPGPGRLAPAGTVPEEAGAGPGRPVVLAAGRLAPQKGLDVLLDAAARWRDLDPAPLVVIVGDGPLAGKLRARAVALGVPAVFLGHRDDVPARLAAAAVFVLPSRWEGQPLVLQEALRAGAAIVATRVGGVPGLTGEDAALLVPAGDARAISDAVRSVLTDPGLAGRLTAAARARAAALPTEEEAAAAAVTAYDAVTR